MVLRHFKVAKLCAHFLNIAVGIVASREGKG